MLRDPFYKWVFRPNSLIKIIFKKKSSFKNTLLNNPNKIQGILDGLEGEIRFLHTPKEAFLPTLQTFLTNKFRLGLQKKWKMNLKTRIIKLN